MLDTKNVLNWLNDFADVIQKNKAYLSELDTPIGDGDHGNNMNRGVIAMQTEFAKTPPNTISDVFRITAMALMGNIGGASGPLYGSAFMEMAKAAKETNELPTIIQAGLNGIIKRGKATCGEKTMVDVWAPVSKSLLANQLTQQVIDSAVELIMISFILVSHSKKITDGLKEMIDQMALNQENVTVFSLGGTSDGDLGTDPIAIYETFQKRKSDDAILVFTDIGSAVMSSETAVDMLDEDIKQKVYIVNCPLIEGAFMAAVQIESIDSLESIFEELKSMSK